MLYVQTNWQNTKKIVQRVRISLVSYKFTEMAKQPNGRTLNLIKLMSSKWFFTDDTNGTYERPLQRDTIAECWIDAVSLFGKRQKGKQQRQSPEYTMTNALQFKRDTQTQRTSHSQSHAKMGKNQMIADSEQRIINIILVTHAHGTHTHRNENNYSDGRFTCQIIRKF